METQCSKMVYYSGVHSLPCQKKATVEREGKSYCTIHDPEYINEKSRKWNEKFDKERAVKQKQYARHDAMVKACEGLTTEELEALTPGKVKASNAMYEALKALAFRFAGKVDEPCSAKDKGVYLQAREALVEATE